MKVDEILRQLIAREGGYVNHPADAGGPTKYGITAATLGLWRGLPEPAPAEEVEALMLDEALAIYRERYILWPGFHKLPEPLDAQMVDFGVNSGPARAVRWLQRTLQVPITGVLDGATLDAVRAADLDGYLLLLNNALVAARLYMIDRWSDANPTQKVFEEGVESRALEFLWLI